MSKSLWQGSVQMQEHPALKKNTETDVLVVGAGMTGMLTAYLLQCSGLQSVVIDADGVGGATSARNTGKLTAQHGAPYHRLLEQGKETAAKNYYNFNRQGMELVKRLVEEHCIPCSFTPRTAYIYTTNLDRAEVLKKEHGAYKKLGISGELVESIGVPIGVQLALSMKGQYSLNPYAFLAGLSEAYLNRGGRIYGHTCATDLEWGDGGCTVKAANGHIVHSKKVVIASHFPFFDGGGMYFAKMAPNRSYIVAARTDRIDEGMYISIDDEPPSNTRSVSFAEVDGRHYLLVGGEAHRTGEENEGAYQRLREFARGYFGAQCTEFEWSAQDYMPTDDIPYVGRLTAGNEQVFVATGFAKWGNSTSAGAAIVLRDLVADGGSIYEDMLSPSRMQAVLNTEFVKDNLISMGSLISSKLSPADELAPQRPGEGRVIELDGKKYGCYMDEEGCRHTVDITCTHMGCELSFNALEHSWDCPCHGSRFGYDGSVLDGPAVMPLKRWGDGSNDIDPKIFG